MGKTVNMFKKFSDKRKGMMCGILLSLSVLSGCSFIPTEYKMDIQQGNLVTQDMVNQLKPGLTQNQVKFIMGTPLLTDIFHADRWDYVYDMNFRNNNGKDQRRILSIYFDKNSKLLRVDGDVNPVPQHLLPENQDVPREVIVDTLKPGS